MCIGGGGGDGGAAEARKKAEAEEAAKNAKIAQGRESIDKAFTQYNDDYFNKYKSDYTNYYNTDLDNQYKTAVDQLTAALAGNGMLGSSAGADKLAKLSETLATQRALTANKAGDASNDLRAKLADQKSNLYSLNQATADPDSINSQALAASSSFAAPSAFSPLENVFASVLTPVTAYQVSKTNSVSGPNRSSGVSAPASGSSGSSYISR